MQLSDFAYDLPEELIARYPLPERSASRLLCLSRETGEIRHQQFRDLPALLTSKDLLVFNNTKVIPARLWGHKESGGRIEMLVERILDDSRVIAHVRASKTPRAGSVIVFANDVRFKVLGRQEELFELQCESSEPVLTVIEKIGEIPLPPYFHRAPDAEDLNRYQTIYAEHKGSVAAPTAGLHFDTDIMKKLEDRGIAKGIVTLHVGAGTFAPVRTEDITQHRMHAEYAMVSAELCEQIRETKARGGRVIAVGTTSARCLESAAVSGSIKPFQGDTTIFIYPGYQFKCIDGLLTNFHLPASTLLMLVCALGGYESVMRAYQSAVKERYRFFSYGDAMLITAADERSQTK